ncbi:MAG: XdhC/CoxI family protein, partial [Candidatus Izemoplasmatales bacterium]
YERYFDLKRRGIPIMVVTAVAKEGSGPVDVGKKMVVFGERESFGTVGGGAIEHLAQDQARQLLKERRHLLQTYLLDEEKVIPNTQTVPMVCGGQVTLYYEYVGPRATVYLFGAGHVGQALARILHTLDFHLIVIDPRDEVLKRFEMADEKYNDSFADFITRNSLEPQSLVVVATPAHQSDYHVINKIIELQLEPRYVGMLCSPEKLADYLERTTREFGKEVNLSYFYSPIGLDTGGNTPEEIAVSISAEMLAVIHGKTGHKHLREVHHAENHYW